LACTRAGHTQKEKKQNAKTPGIDEFSGGMKSNQAAKLH
jgi:hypothetical protein